MCAFVAPRRATFTCSGLMGFVTQYFTRPSPFSFHIVSSWNILGPANTRTYLIIKFEAKKRSLRRGQGRGEKGGEGVAALRWGGFFTDNAVIGQRSLLQPNLIMRWVLVWRQAGKAKFLRGERTLSSLAGANPAWQSITPNWAATIENRPLLFKRF